jgi:hypothetical protein
VQPGSGWLVIGGSSAFVMLNGTGAGDAGNILVFLGTPPLAAAVIR